MCNNEKLSHIVKVKSRNAELFLFKKNDFLKLSFSYKEFVNTFLQKSIILYIKFNDEKKTAIQQYEKENNIKQSIFKNELEEIDEESDIGEEYDVYADHNVYTDQESDNKNPNQEKVDQSNISEKKNLENETDMTKNNKNYPFEFLRNSKEKENKKPSFLNSKALKSKNRNSLINTGIGDEGDNTKNKRRNSFEHRMPDTYKNFKTDVEPTVELTTYVENFKKNLHNKFSENVDDIIQFLEQHKSKFKILEGENNPMNLLVMLKRAQDPNEKNELIEKLEILSHNF